MKKPILISCIFFLVSFIGITYAIADTITINAPSALNSLYGESADELYSKWYSWALDYDDLGIPDDQFITNAYILVDNAYLNDPTPTCNMLYIDLLYNPLSNNSTIGYRWGYDLKNGVGVLDGDFFLDSGIFHLTPLIVYSDSDPGTSSTRVDLFYNITPYLITGMMEDGNIGIGLDPDCYWRNDGMSINVQTASVPIPPSLLLIGSGIFGLAILRGRWKRQF